MSRERGFWARQAPCPEGVLYTIRAGDTLYSLARRFGTTVEAIASANPGLDPRNLQIGRQICIPGVSICPEEASPYVIKPGDTLYLLAQRLGVELSEIIALNPGVDPSRLQVGQIICLPRPMIPITFPCCKALAPFGLVDSATGLVLINEFDGRYRLTFAVNGLPDPSMFGGFDAYAASFIRLGPPPERAQERPVIESIPVLLGRAQVQTEEQPVTWCGSKDIEIRPQADDVIIVSPTNTGTGTTGTILFRGNLEACRSGRNQL